MATYPQLADGPGRSSDGGRGETRTQVQQYQQLRASLWAERATFDAHWRELGDYYLPRRPRFWITDRNKGDKRNQNLIDNTPRFAARTLQSGLHAGLTSPARPWMRLSTPDPELAEMGAVKIWLHTVTQRMLTVFLRSNLYNALPILYGDMGVFGTGAMGVLEDDEDLLRCYCYPIGSYALGLNTRGIVDTFIREYVLTVRQLIQEFGGLGGGPGRRGRTLDRRRFSQSVLNLWDRGDTQVPIEVCWIVSPNDDADPDRPDARGLPFRSCYYEQGGDGTTMLRESGFHQFPVLAPRWDVTGEDTYGTDCPGMTALGDNKALQVMQKNKAKAVEKLVNPPLVGPEYLRTQKVSLVAGDVTYADVREGMQGIRPIHEVKPDLGQFVADIRETQYRIQRAFYEDLFLMLATSDSMRGSQPVTAREIEERHEEKLLALGPVLERTNDELLDPLIDRVFAMMTRLELIPPPPPDIQGVELKVEYISLMAQAQKLVGVVGADRFFSNVQVLASTWPEVLDKVDAQQAVDDYADMLGVNPKIVRADDVAAQLTQAKQAAAQAQLQSAQLKDTAQSAKALGDTPMDGDTALTRLVSQVQQGQGAPAAA